MTDYASADIELHIQGAPVVWRAPYVGSRGAYSPKANEKRIVSEFIRQQYKGEPTDRLLRCDLYFYLPIPKSTSKKKRQQMLDGDIRPTAGGDLTNLRKFIEDCMNGIVYLDDRQIVEGETQKWFDDKPETVVQIMFVNSPY